MAVRGKATVRRRDAVQEHRCGKGVGWGVGARILPRAAMRGHAGRAVVPAACGKRRAAHQFRRKPKFLLIIFVQLTCMKIMSVPKTMFHTERTRVGMCKALKMLRKVRTLEVMMSAPGKEGEGV